jgi:hypothetical protein
VDPLGGGGLNSTGSGQRPVMSCCEYNDKPSGSCATELVPYWEKTLSQWLYFYVKTKLSMLCYDSHITHTNRNFKISSLCLLPFHCHME